MRNVILIGLLFFSLLSSAAAAELKARVAAIDLDKRTIALTVSQQDQAYDLAKDCKVYKRTGDARTGPGYNEVPGGLKAVTVGDEVTVATDFLEGKEQVVRIKIETSTKKRKHLGRDVSGKVAVIDAEKRIIALTIDDKEQKFELSTDCNVYKLIGSGSRAHFVPVAGGLNEVTVGAEVTLNLDARNGKEQVAYIQIGLAEQKKEKK